MKFRRLTALLALAALTFIPLTSCDGTGGGGASKLGKALTKVTGKLKGLGEGKVKVSALVGKKIIPAVIEKGEFTFNNLPPGDKSILVEKDGQRMPVKFPKSKAKSGVLSGMIPDAGATSEEFDFGDMQMFDPKADGAGAYIVCQNNPFESLFDFDGDGSFDFLDDDVDGDGTFNWDDASAWGDEYADWGWDDEFLGDEFDTDGDGTWDWDDEDAWDDWGWDGEGSYDDEWGYEYDEADWEGYEDTDWFDESEYDEYTDIGGDDFGGDDFGGDDFGGDDFGGDDTGGDDFGGDDTGGDDTGGGSEYECPDGQYWDPSSESCVDYGDF